MSRHPKLAALLATGLAAGLPATPSDEAHLADLVARSARWLSSAPGYVELKETGISSRLLREVIRLSLVRAASEADVVGRVLDPMALATAHTPRQLARLLLARVGALPRIDRIVFLGLVARVAPAEVDADWHDTPVEAMLQLETPKSPFLPQKSASGPVATDERLQSVARAVLESLHEALGTREEPGDLPLEMVADRLLDE
jgi:hypothetical protein